MKWNWVLSLGRHLLVGTLCLAISALSWADILNTASVAYTDVSGNPFSGLSNLVTVTTAESGSLPTLSVALPSYIGIDDSLSVPSYSDNNVNFVWSFVPMASGPGSAPSIIARTASSASFKSGTETASLASYGLSAGIYQVSVYAVDNTNANNVSNTVSATITLLTVVETDFSAVQIYPNPWRSDKHAGMNVTFANLPPGSTVRIFTISGHLVKTLTPNIATASWDLTNDSADKVASGIYVYLITDSNGDKARGKVAVIR